MVLSCLGVSKSFDVEDGGGVWRLTFGRPDERCRFLALDGVTIEVPKGKFVGVIGRNGAGKSTLLRTLGGVYVPDVGTVSVIGSMSGLYELGLAGHRDLSGRSYARRILDIQGVARRDMEALIAEIEDFSELGQRFDDPVFSYSSGMAARLFFSTATAQQHDVYLIDEVLSVGDEHFQQKCWRRMRERLSGGASGVLVTHDWSAVLKICETAHILDHGRIALSGPSDNVVRTYLDVGNLKALETKQARLLEPFKERIRWVQGEDASLTLSGEIYETGLHAHFAFAIEQMTIGVGWEIILNGIDLPLTSAQGRFDFTLTIPQLPLVPGEYQLSYQLVAVGEDRIADRTVLDGRGWLMGSPCVIEVTGPDIVGQVALPLTWNVAAA
jgi:lipopolysaccharide transport system ATP-binding protein